MSRQDAYREQGFSTGDYGLIMQPIHQRKPIAALAVPASETGIQANGRKSPIRSHSHTRSLTHSHTLVRPRVDDALTGGREAPRQRTGQLARADETHTHGRRIPASADPETLGILGSGSEPGKTRIRRPRCSFQAGMHRAHSKGGRD